MRRSLVVILTIVALVAVAAPQATARPQWKSRIDRLVRHKSVAVQVKVAGDSVYSHAARNKLVPASNQKLLMSMALLDRLEPGYRIETSVVGPPADNGVVDGDVYVLGHGDPSIASGGAYARSLPFEPTRLGTLVHRINSAGIRRIEGDIVGSTGYFLRDWWAPGWSSYFPLYEVARPTALTLDGNFDKGTHIDDPELRLARALVNRLEARGVKVTGRAAVGQPPEPAVAATIASVRSQPLRTLVRYMNRHSSNFFAEVLGKRLGAERSRPRANISTGARAIAAWAADHGVGIASYDASGLSYRNRISPTGMVRLLEAAEREPWGDVVRKGLPTGGEGTLEDRLQGIPIRAKTGSLIEVSALSGWLGLRRVDQRAEFSILSTGLPKWVAADLEDRIVRILHRRAADGPLRSHGVTERAIRAQTAD